MQISATTDTVFSARRRPKTSEKPSAASRALVVVEKTAQSARRTRDFGHAPQRSSAFLAHLSLQYDTIAVRRRERAERLNHAVARYGSKPHRELKATFTVVA